MEYKTEGCSFSIKDTVTVRDQLRYSGLVAFTTNAERILTLWDAAQPLITAWECELIPDLETYNMDEETNPKQAEIIAWVGTKVWSHMNGLEEIPKK